MRDPADLENVVKMSNLPTVQITGRRATRAAADARVRVTLPPRSQMAADARSKAEAEKRPLTVEEQRLQVFALPRKVRRANKIPTTPHKAGIAALRAMSTGAEVRGPQYTGNKMQHQQRYDSTHRAIEAPEADLLALEVARDNRRILREERATRAAARRAKFDAKRLAT